MFLSNLKHNIFKFLFSPKVDVVGGDCDRDTHCVPPKICENGNSVLGIVQVLHYHFYAIIITLQICILCQIFYSILFQYYLVRISCIIF